MPASIRWEDWKNAAIKQAHNRDGVATGTGTLLWLEYRDDFDVPQLPEGFADKALSDISKILFFALSPMPMEFGK